MSETRAEVMSRLMHNTLQSEDMRNAMSPAPAPLFRPGLHLASAHLVAVADDPGALGRAFNVGGRELRTLCDVLRGQAAALEQMAKGRGE